jgi:hypothetical protein
MNCSMSVLSLSSCISQLSFRLLQPDAARGEDRRFILERSSGQDARLLELPHAPFDVWNSYLAARDPALRQALLPICEIHRMSTFSVGALINRAVAQMPPDQAYINVGVWHGFSLLAGMLNNREKICVGVDNFSQFGGPRAAFTERFENFSSPSHRFYEMDYRDYLSKLHREPIGVYFYDGSHAYENQLEGLREAEPFMADGCVVFVDDTNWPAPYKATYDFIETSEREYTVLLDRRTAGNAHPTFWNGLIVLRATGRKRSGAARKAPAQNASADATDEPRSRNRLPPFGPVAVEPNPPLVTIVVHNDQPDAARLEGAIEGALDQTWPATEVVVANDDPSGECAKLLAAYGDRISAVAGKDAPDAPSINEAVASSDGDFVCFVGADHSLRKSAVHVGLAFPGYSGFEVGKTAPAYRRKEQALLLIDEVATVVPAGETFALVNEKLAMPKLDTSRRPIPFYAADGQSAARPPDGAAAIEELERLRGSGTDYIVFTWPAFAWLSEYPDFHSHLRATARCALENERLVVFDLRR